MPEFTTPVPPREALDRIEHFARDPREERLPAALREKRLVRLSLYERTENGFTLHFGIRSQSRTGISRYVDGNVEPAGTGSLVCFSLRAALSPRLAMSLLLGLVLIQDIYELVRGTFSSFNAGFTIVAPLAGGLLALLEKRMIARNFDAGMTDALRQAVLQGSPE